MLCRVLVVVLVEVSEMIQHQLHLVLYQSLSLAYSSFILYTLQWCNQLRLRNTCVYIDDIDSKSHKMEQKLFQPIIQSQNHAASYLWPQERTHTH